MVERGTGHRRPLAIALAVVLSVAACASNRTPERTFATRAEAEASGMFDAAGVPVWLVPSSAQHLRERRNIGTGEIWARFEFAEGDTPDVSERCTRAGEVRLAGSATRGIGWWPELLRGDTATARQHFDLHVCEEAGGPATVAIHKAMTTAFYWRSR